MVYLRLRLKDIIMFGNFYLDSMDKIVYDIRWSDELDDKFISDFLFVQQSVFNCGDSQGFRRQFLDNIYGKSVLVVVYMDDNPVAARCLWRNDIGGKEAYQPGGTCVLPVCRGKGIFREMTMRAIAVLNPETIIYNFPNSNSFAGYIKMGWKLIHDYGVRLFTSYKDYIEEHPIKMDREYANWWVKGKKLFYVCLQGHYFLTHKDHRPFCYRIFAEVDKEIALEFQKAGLGLFFYRSERQTWYSKRFALSHLVGRNLENSYIPTWKVDAI